MVKYQSDFVNSVTHNVVEIEKRERERFYYARILSLKWDRLSYILKKHISHLKFAFFCGILMNKLKQRMHFVLFVVLFDVKNVLVYEKKNEPTR